MGEVVIFDNGNSEYQGEHLDTFFLSSFSCPKKPVSIYADSKVKSRIFRKETLDFIKDLSLSFSKLEAYKALKVEFKYVNEHSHSIAFCLEGMADLESSRISSSIKAKAESVNIGMVEWKSRGNYNFQLIL